MIFARRIQGQAARTRVRQRVASRQQRHTKTLIHDAAPNPGRDPSTQAHAPWVGMPQPAPRSPISVRAPGRWNRLSMQACHSSGALHFIAMVAS